MRTSILISTFIFLSLSSCDQSQTPDTTPKALEDKSSSYEIISKRGYDDLIESLYLELAENTPELKALENQIDMLDNSRDDSAMLFNKYDAKNKSYYSSANNHIDQIKDSVLKERMKSLVAGSLARYNLSVSNHNNIINSIGNKYILLNDLQLVLKISRTLPLIEQYQKDNLPSTIPLEGFSKQLDKTIKYADSLTKK